MLTEMTEEEEVRREVVESGEQVAEEEGVVVDSKDRKGEELDLQSTRGPLEGLEKEV